MDMPLKPNILDDISKDVRPDFILDEGVRLTHLTELDSRASTPGEVYLALWSGPNYAGG